jgi:hypothetical protein
LLHRISIAAFWELLLLAVLPPLSGLQLLCELLLLALHWQLLLLLKELFLQQHPLGQSCLLFCGGFSAYQPREPSYFSPPPASAHLLVLAILRVGRRLAAIGMRTGGIGTSDMVEDGQY